MKFQSSQEQHIWHLDKLMLAESYTKLLEYTGETTNKQERNLNNNDIRVENFGFDLLIPNLPELMTVKKNNRFYQERDLQHHIYTTRDCISQTDTHNQNIIIECDK